MTPSDFVLKPSLSDYLDYYWRRSGVTQGEIAEKANTSPGYFRKLLSGESRNPTPNIVGHLADAFDFNDDKRRHLADLARLDDAREWPIPPLCTEASPEQLAVLHDQAAPAALINSSADLIEVNESHREWFPDHSATMNSFAYMMLNPRSKETLMDWEAEALETVGLMRMSFVKTGLPDWTIDVLESVAGSENFQRLWATREVRYQRRSRHTHIWGPDGRPYSMIIQHVPLGGRSDLTQLMVCAPGPFCGPPELLAG